GTALHMARLKEFGPCPAHRRSFAPVRRLLEVS
ncbi:MAG: ribonuclease HII, partial [Alcaligenaceae bacterium]